jgi:hypothetical protein
MSANDVSVTHQPLGLALCANMSGTRCLSSIRVEGEGDVPHHA